MVMMPAVSAFAQTVDTSALMLRGSRAEGSFALPSARLLEPGAWEVSFGYEHDGEVVRVETATGGVRGGALTQPVRWVDQREVGWVQAAFSPFQRLELNASLPVVLGQSASAVTGADTPASGSAALGDAAFGVRFALLDPLTFAQRGLQWAVQGGLLAPTGSQAAAFGEHTTRAEASTTVTWHSGAAWALTGHAGYQTGKALQLADQLFGDRLSFGAAFAYRLGVVQLSGELVSRVTLGPAAVQTQPGRASLEALVGARYLAEHFFVDLGVGVAPIDDGVTPRWRLQLAFGARGRPAPPPVPVPVEPKERCPAPEPAKAAIVPEARPADPVPEPVKPDPRTTFRAQALLEQTVSFEVGSTTLDAVATSTVREVARTLLSQTGAVLITGHADDQGPEPLNDELSLKRAEAVKKVLIEAGVAADRLAVRGAGRREPVTSTPGFGRSLNRAVRFSWANELPPAR
jgi:outer membrane protein OmpA-like peptidoglycan-associated protein